MSRVFEATKEIPLDFVGPSWEGAYLEVSLLTLSDIEKASALFSGASSKRPDEENIKNNAKGIAEFLEEKFISGKAPEKNVGLVELRKEDLKHLPLAVLVKATNFLSQETTIKNS